MSGLVFFALIVLLVLILADFAVWVSEYLLGCIARNRYHSQAKAINIYGWWGVVTLGLKRQRKPERMMTEIH